MSKLNQIESNGTTYDVEDSGAVRFDGSQSLSAAQQTTARGNIGAVADNQGAANAGKVLTVDMDGSVVLRQAQHGFNDAFRHYLEGTLRAGMYIEDVSMMIARIVAAMEGVDGVEKSGSTLTMTYSLNDPEKTGTALVFS